MEDSFSSCSQAMAYRSPSTGFFPAYRPFTPASEPFLSLDASANNSSHCAESTFPSTMNIAMICPVLKTEPKQMQFDDDSDTPPTTPLRQGPIDFEYMEINMAQNSPIGSFTSSSSFDMYTVSPGTAISPASRMMEPSHTPFGSDTEDIHSCWLATKNSLSSFPIEQQVSSDFEGTCVSRPSIYTYYTHDLTSPRAQRMMMVHEVQPKTIELQGSQIQTPKKQSSQYSFASLDVIGKDMYICDYPGCSKKFRRKEHLKRHKQTFHGEGPNRFSCEFCGKDQFNRQDNLNIHRRVHARPTSGNRRIKYIPAAAVVIEEENRNRKRRAPREAKQQLGKWSLED